ncbi:MAG TPA: PepSY-associated TM helix domain-containing protein [Paraburkholderia sp.]|jgi:uncharacterized iron-regulated membrane protein|nr:PepSY-associated TM helix domain-containing protein [Paraburkholderia sp.]
MRHALVRLHRWFGIGTALFLFVAGLTGALIAWDHELDALLNPTFFYAHSDAQPLSSLELAHRVEANDPRLQVTYLPLSVEPGHALQMMVLPRVDRETNQPYPLDFNQIAVDPSTGAIQGRREWGALSVARLNLMPFIYKLHYTLFLPSTRGIDIGTWLMGIVGIVWTVDSVIALVLSFPSMKAWKKSLAFRVRRGGYALTFDLHRSGGVWIWGLLLMMAVTSVSMNLSAPVVQPIVRFFSTLTPTPFTDPSLLPAAKPDEAPIAREQVLKLAEQARADRHIDAPPGAIYYAPMLHVYGIGYFNAGDDHGDDGLGNAWTYWNAQNGQPLGAQIPGKGTAGDLFMQAQFPLHSGRILGLGGRILISCVGVMVAVLSTTGLLIWLKKLNARRQASSARRASARAVQTQTESAASR